MDSKLDFEYQAQVLLKKLASAQYSIKKASPFLNREELRLIHNAFFRSHLNYSIPYLGACSQATLDKISKAEKKIIRLVEGEDFRAHTSPLFKVNNILPIRPAIKHFAANFMFKVHKRKAPESICNLYVKQAETRQTAYRLRHHNDIDFYKPNRMCYKHLENLPKFAYINTFNNVPMEIKELETANMFYNAYKKLLLQEI